MAVSEAQKKASRKYNDEYTRQVKFSFSTKYDLDILAALDAVQNKQGYIKELIRSDIARKAGELPEEKRAEEKPAKRISLDGGAHFLTAEKAIREINKRKLWNILPRFMEDETWEAVRAEGSATEEEYLRQYLSRAKSDLIIP